MSSSCGLRVERVVTDDSTGCVWDSNPSRFLRDSRSLGVSSDSPALTRTKALECLSGCRSTAMQLSMSLTLSDDNDVAFARKVTSTKGLDTGCSTSIDRTDIDK